MRIPLMAFIAAILLTSCTYFGGKRIYGNGSIQTRQVPVGAFHSVDVSGNIRVLIRQEPSSAVKVETDENLVEYLDIYAEEEKLVIEARPGYNLRPSKEIIVHVAAPEFREVIVSGSCDIIGDGPVSVRDALNLEISGSGHIEMDVMARKLSTRISGSGSMKLRGRVTNFTGRVSGSADIRCFDLETDNVRLDLSGASDAEITANQKIDIRASGASTVSYKGNASVTQKISGAGSVKKIG